MIGKNAIYIYIGNRSGVEGWQTVNTFAANRPAVDLGYNQITSHAEMRIAKKKYRFKDLPVLICFKDGKIKDRIYDLKEMVEWIKN